MWQRKAEVAAKTRTGERLGTEPGPNPSGWGHHQAWAETLQLGTIPTVWAPIRGIFPPVRDNPCQLGTILRGALAGMSQTGREVPRRRNFGPIEIEDLRTWSLRTLPRENRPRPETPSSATLNSGRSQTSAPTNGRERTERNPTNGAALRTRATYPNTGTPARTSRQFSSANADGSMLWFATT